MKTQKTMKLKKGIEGNHSMFAGKKKVYLIRGVPTDAQLRAVVNKLADDEKAKIAKADFDKGLAFFRKDQFEEAIACFKKVLKINPKDTETLNLLGQAFDATGQHVKAVASLEKAIKIDPNYSLAYYDLGTILAKKQKSKDAMRRLEKYLSMQPSADSYMIPGALYGIACLHALAGRMEEALNFFKQALKKGFSDRRHINNDIDLDQLRSDPRFIKLMTNYFPKGKKIS